jgi:hypothetical protein
MNSELPAKSTRPQTWSEHRRARANAERQRVRAQRQFRGIQRQARGELRQWRPAGETAAIIARSRLAQTMAHAVAALAAKRTRRQP